MMIAYTLMFGAIATGAVLAFRFYQSAMERAGAERELQLARKIQRSFLLSDFPRRPRIQVHAANLSSKEVSGDFYDVVTAHDSETVLAIADVSGKGVPAALLSSMLQASLRTQAGGVASPAAMMAALNRLVCQRPETGQFATFFLAVIDEPTLTLRFTNAGHNFPILERAAGGRERLERGGVVIGMREDATYEEAALRLAAGDRLVLYTDGVTEAARADGEMFGEARLEALLGAVPREAPADAVVDQVLAGVRGFLDGVEPGDDITVMVLRVLPAGDGSGAAVC
jgi:sigma-B regulation protein RsbU (phosphoserine phosphatase)